MFAARDTACCTASSFGVIAGAAAVGTVMSIGSNQPNDCAVASAQPCDAVVGSKAPVTAIALAPPCAGHAALQNESRRGARPGKGTRPRGHARLIPGIEMPADRRLMEQRRALMRH